MIRASQLLVFLFGAFGFLACDSFRGCAGRERPVVRVDVVDRSAQKPGALDTHAMETASAEAVDRLPGFGFRRQKSGETPWQLTIEIRMVTDRTSDRDPKLRRRALGLSAVLKALGPVEGSDRFATDTLLAEDVDQNEAFDRFAVRAIKKAFSELKLAVELTDASPEDVIAAIKQPESSLRARAVVVAGERRLIQAVPVLIETLDKETQEDVVSLIMGALVAIGDSRAVGPLIDAGRHQSGEYLTQILFAVAQLGGKEAEAYLFTVQSGHPDPVVRQNAQQALDELESRKRGEGVAQDPSQ